MPQKCNVNNKIFEKIFEWKIHWPYCFFKKKLNFYIFLLYSHCSVSTVQGNIPVYNWKKKPLLWLKTSSSRMATQNGIHVLLTAATTVFKTNTNFFFIKYSYFLPGYHRNDCQFLSVIICVFWNEIISFSCFFIFSFLFFFLTAKRFTYKKKIVIHINIVRRHG